MKPVSNDSDPADHFDVVVIGGGAAGSAATNAAVQGGARVALIEQYRLGGT